jgi:predicted GNAT superfamily acetyltransferase
MSEPFTIRKAESIADYRACQDAQRLAWGLRDEGYIVPLATMVGAQLHGGLVLGAFLPDGTAAGLSFGFLGRVDGRVGLYSQLTGVIPAYQSRGLGEALKRAQFDWARAEGLALVAWAFDPLQAGNAHFNLRRLGARVRQYVDNMYGPRTDAVNAGGLPTDRLIAVWEPELSPPPEPPAPAALPALLATARQPDGRIAPVGVADVFDAPMVLLEVPAEIADLRLRDPALAEAWRVAVRSAFRRAFENGREAAGFARWVDHGHRRAAYVLTPRARMG